MELDDILHKEIEDLCEEGDRLVENEKFTEALKNYWKAFDLLPEPKIQWDASTWILTAIGDANFLNKDFIAGRDNFGFAMQCPDAIGNPFVHLRLGQCYFELNELEKSADELCRAYMGAGEEIFEDEDKKYLDFLKSKIKLDGKKPWWRIW